MLFNIFYIAAQFSAGAQIFETILGMDYRTGLVIIAVIVITCVFVGGYYAAVYTDALEALLVLMIGVPEREYQAGGDEKFTISELTKPFEAMANKVGMTYMSPFTIFQFAYLEDDVKMDTLIEYWQYLTMENNRSLATKESWLIEQLQNLTLPSEDQETVRFVIERIQENRENLNELKLVLDQMYGG